MTAEEKVEFKKYKKNFKNRLRENGLDDMTDFEVVELILLYGKPNDYSTDLVTKLFEMYGTLSNILEAGAKELARIEGMNEQSACLLNMILPTCARFEMSGEPKKKDFSTDEKIYKYLKPRFYGSNKEKVIVMFFNEKGKFITSEKLGEGNYSATDIDVKQIICIAIDLKCTEIIIAHNHPHGFAKPSSEDITATAHMMSIFKLMGIKIRDHFVLSDDDYFSMAHSETTNFIFQQNIF